jgi:hypothetical protein
MDTDWCHTSSIDSHQRLQVQHLVDYAIHQQGLSKTEAIILVLEEFGISDIITRHLLFDMG